MRATHQTKENKQGDLWDRNAPFASPTVENVQNVIKSTKNVSKRRQGREALVQGRQAQGHISYPRVHFLLQILAAWPWPVAVALYPMQSHHDPCYLGSPLPGNTVRGPSRQSVITNIQTFVIFFFKLLNPSKSRPGNKEKIQNLIKTRIDFFFFCKEPEGKSYILPACPFPTFKDKEKWLYKKLIIIILELKSKMGDVVQSLERLPSMQ